MNARKGEEFDTEIFYSGDAIVRNSARGNGTNGMKIKFEMLNRKLMINNVKNNVIFII